MFSHATLIVKYRVVGVMIIVTNKVYYVNTVTEISRYIKIDA
jgi:hypothetical protein